MDPGDAVRKVVIAWEGLDAASLAELFAADGVFDDPLMPERLIGRDAIRAGVEEGMRQLTSCRIELTHLLEEGVTALAEGRFVADTADRDKLDFCFALVAELGGGKITRLAEYFDTRLLVE